MIHQKNKNLASKYYHQKTGCLDFPKHKWQAWYEEYTEKDSDLFYAFVQDDNGRNIGEVSFYKSTDGISYDMNLLIEGKYRDKGYGQEALHQTLLIAFKKFNVSSINLEIDANNIAGIKLCEKARFTAKNHLGDKIEYILNKKTFINNEAKIKMYS